MKQSNLLFLSYQLIKAAATAPQSMAGGVGGAGIKAPAIAGANLNPGTPPLSSQWNNWESSMAKSPMEAAAANPLVAPGGLQAASAARQGTPVSSMLQGFKKQMSGWGRTAHF